ncbi:hypothetical protein GGF47_002359 [Coemansia sp. RSA 2524]|nr:hypothetical protein GGF47_002359 [Coemansia sp. RSA 2524]
MASALPMAARRWCLTFCRRWSRSAATALATPRRWSSRARSGRRSAAGCGSSSAMRCQCWMPRMHRTPARQWAALGADSVVAAADAEALAVVAEDVAEGAEDLAVVAAGGEARAADAEAAAIEDKVLIFATAPLCPFAPNHLLHSHVAASS